MADLPDFGPEDADGYATAEEVHATPDDPTTEWARPREPSGRRRSKWWIAAVALTGWLVISLIALAALLIWQPFSHSASPAPSATVSGQATDPDPLPLPSGWSQRASDSQTNCATHSYGKVKVFLMAHPCTGLRRLLSTTSQNGHDVVIASHAVRFSSPALAEQYRALVTSDGTGNISNLLLEGAKIPEGTTAMADTAAFTAVARGTQVLVAEACYATGKTPAADPALLKLTQRAVG